MVTTNNQTIFYHIFDLTTGIYEIHSTGKEDKTQGIIQVSDTGKVYDYETKTLIDYNTLLNISQWEDDTYEKCFYKKLN